MLEKDIETAFCEWITTSEGTVLGRQVNFPIGRADVIGLCSGIKGINVPFVAEIKRGRIDEMAFTQLCGYLGQLKYQINPYSYGPGAELIFNHDGLIRGLLIGISISPMAKRAMLSSNQIRAILYSVQEGVLSFEWADKDARELDGFHDEAFDSLLNICRKNIALHCSLMWCDLLHPKDRIGDELDSLADTVPMWEREKRRS